jgi:hypothetical protein
MKAKAGRSADKPRCGLCGKTRALTRTECCGRWICDDEHKYVLFSYALNSCHRNHRRLTLCGYHHVEGHAGSWKECSLCKCGFETEMYVWYGTNEYNFERLEHPPSYEPTKCSMCGTVIVLSQGGYSMRGTEYWCEACTVNEMESVFRRTSASSGQRARGAHGGKPTRPRRARRG